MPSRPDHIAKAEANELLAHTLQVSYPDWALTVLFYSALHWVDAVLDGLNGASVHPQRHRDRHSFIAQDPQLRVFEPEYSSLWNMSENARYYCELFFPDDVGFVLTARFDPVKSECKRLLAPP